MRNQFSPEESRVAIGALINSRELLEELLEVVPPDFKIKTEITISFINEIFAKLGARDLLYPESKPDLDSSRNTIAVPW